MSLQLEIVTPKGSVISTSVEEVMLPGSNGEFGVLDGHIPLLAALRPGVVRFKSQGKEARLAVSVGFAEVGANERVLVLTDNHAFPDQIELEAVYAELRDAEAALKEWAGGVEELDAEKAEWKEVPDHRELRIRADWAQARIDVKKSAAH